jgi:class 3 adenylate cyclase/predicted ATPase
MDIEAWLQGLGLERYVPAFRDNEIDEEVLPKLTSEDLREIGVSAIGPRRKLLDAIAALGGPASTAAVKAAISDASASADAERRQLTVMFCDLVGSTALSSRLDPEDLREVIGAYHGCVTDTVARFSGFVAKYMGDGVLVYFGYPEAHEDDAERAVRAGLSVIAAVSTLTTPERLSVRIGIGSGLVVVGDLIGAGAAQERGVVGETPNLAARLQALAAPGTLVIAESTRRQIGAFFEIEDLGPQPLAGFAEPQRASRVLGESGVLSRFEALRSRTTPLIGRAEELNLLLRRWAQATAGDGQVVLLSGEPGIGKSRLTAAVQETIGAAPHIRIPYFCSPHHRDSALYPVIAQLERAAGFERGDTAETRLDKLEALLAPNHPTDDDIALIAELLSVAGGERHPPLDLGPQRKKERLFSALLRQLDGLAKRRPVLMIFEDLHWADPTSREMLDLMVERVAPMPVLLVVTFRPEFRPVWSGPPHVTMQALNRLGGGDCAVLVRQLAGNAGLSGKTVDEIVERTDGVPLFVEEVTKAVVEAGADRLALASVPAAPLAVPATLDASLLARLDRLGSAAKLVAQTGAAIGREFLYELLSASIDRLGERELNDALHRLVEAGVVFQRGAPPTAEYLFKHALVQDTAYGTLLRGARRDLHRRIAEALETKFPGLLAVRPEIAAHHFGEALEVEKAVAYWRRAGEVSVAKSAVREATAQLRRGLDLLARLPENADRKRLELDLHVTLTSALMGARGYADPEVAATLERSRRLVTETGGVGTALHFSVLHGIWAVAYIGGNTKPALDHATEFLSLAEAQPASGPLLIGHIIRAASLMMGGGYREVLPHAKMAVSLYRPDEHREFAFRYGQDSGASALCYLSLALWHGGYPDQAIETADRAVSHAREFGHAHTLAYTLCVTAAVAAFARNVAKVEWLANESAAIAARHGFTFWSARSEILLGWVVARRGRASDGVDRMRAGLAAATATGTRFNEPLHLGLIAEGLALDGRTQEGLALLDEALSRAAETGEVSAEAELRRLQGEFLQSLGTSNAGAAEAAFAQAVSVARRQGSRGYELRAATNLARLWRDQGRAGEARDLLAPIHGWFTEGFGTKDLKDAKALLDDLADAPALPAGGGFATALAGPDGG